MEGDHNDMMTGGRRMVIVGNYCHDVLFQDGAVVGKTLGGAAAFASNVLDSLAVVSSSSCRYVSMVGSDFSYFESVAGHPPVVCPFPSKTVLFHAYFSSSSSKRILRLIHGCGPILPADIEGTPCRFDFGLAIGVAGEITPETLARMLDLCHHVIVDIQALIRTFDPLDGTVHLVNLRESGFFDLLPRFSFLKVSAEEVAFVGLQEVRKRCCVIVTEGESGCRIYWSDGELHMPSFRTIEMDSTGAGDSFLGGFVAGLVGGLAVPDAALLGNFFGALTVSQIGVPSFNSKMLKKVKEKLERKMWCITRQKNEDIDFDFRKTEDYEELQAFLDEAARLQTNRCITDHYSGLEDKTDPQISSAFAMLHFTEETSKNGMDVDQSSESN